jgi:hypothetical protein
MSGHEFEKQVRQKLNDLKMTPSTEAWENIENSLRERKRRPAAFYWVPLLLIGLTAGGYLFLNNDHKIVLSDRNSTHNVNVQPKESDEKAAGGDLADASQEKPAPPQENSTSGGKILSEKKNNFSEGENNPDVSGGVIAVAPQEKTRVAAPGKSGSAESIASEKKNDLSGGENKSDASGGVLADAPREKTAYGKNISLKISNYPVGTITPSPLNFIQTPKKSPSKKSNKWSYGLSAFGGISAVNEGHLLNFNNAQVEDVSRVPAFAPRPSYTPSSISPGVTYSGGLFVKRELNRKFSLSLGINYLQLNTRSKVGDREIGNQIVNAGVGGFQAVTSYFRVERDKLSEYHNRYHFIEVPVELHTKLNRSQKTHFVLTTGMAVSQLLRSTSLHFDGTTGVYYRNDELLNQVQVAAKTGVSIGILNKTKRPLWVGPAAKYNISRILEKGVSSKTNFMSIGVDVKMFIK